MKLIKCINLKWGFIIMALLFISNSIFADQLSYISKSQADSAVVLLTKQSEVILWCGCCDNDPKQTIKVTKVYFEFTGHKDFYQVIIVGTDNKGRNVRNEIDLAYIYFNKNGIAQCVGKELGFTCDPCSKPFSWRGK